MIKTLRLLFALFAVFFTAASAVANKKSEEFRQKIEKALPVGTPIQQVRDFLKAERLKANEATNPKAISTSVRYGQSALGYKSTVVAILFDENDRVKEILYKDSTTGL